MAKSKGGKDLETAPERDSDTKSQLNMSRNPYIPFDSLVGVGLGRELSLFFRFSTWRDFGHTTLR